MEDARLQAIYAAQDARIARAKQAIADEANAQNRKERVNRARVRLLPSSTAQCDTAIWLQEQRYTEATLDIIRMVDLDTNALSDRDCGASALVGLGFPDHALAFYKECAALGTPESKRMAMRGFASLGPSAAELALPLISEELKSPYRDRRYGAVDDLARLGPAARPLLESAAHDPEDIVRDRAVKALAGLKPLLD
ncbi:MAG: hypothetical protein ABI672_17600 [Vicinamibacteria bacterium]